MCFKRDSGFEFRHLVGSSRGSSRWGPLRPWARSGACGGLCETMRRESEGLDHDIRPAVHQRRYDHAAVALDGKMFVVGGNARGKLLADTAVLDLTTLSWAARPQPGGSSSVPMGAAATDAMAAAAAALPACAAHAVVVCRGQVNVETINASA
jgi:hypothetical protein